VFAAGAAPGKGRPVRFVFTFYVLLIVSGLVYFSVIGLTHH
jgi:hypothetical protein